MKSIIFIVICLGVTLTRGRRALNDDELHEIGKLKFPQDPECGIHDGEWNYDNPDNFDKQSLPWILSVVRKNDTKHLCDSVLIYPDVLMTSAHCVENVKNEELAVAKKVSYYRLFHGWIFKYICNHAVSEIHINPTYKACSRRNDHAILILSRPFVLNDNIKVACLPPLNISYYNSYCVNKIMENQWTHDCGNRVFEAPSSSDDMEEASCKQGNETAVLIKQTQSYSLSCGTSITLKKFYYVGLIVNVEMCGPGSEKYQFYDTLYKTLPWMYNILKNRFIDYQLDERPIKIQ